MDKYRKAFVAGLAFVLTVVTQLVAAGLVNDQWTVYVQIFITLAGAYGVFAVPNSKPQSLTQLPPTTPDPFAKGL